MILNTTDKIALMAAMVFIGSTSLATETTTNNIPPVFGHIPTITTSPLFGDSSEYDSYDLLYQETSMNEDWYLLKDHQQLINHLKEKIHLIMINQILVDVKLNIMNIS